MLGNRCEKLGKMNDVLFPGNEVIGEYVNLLVAYVVLGIGLCFALWLIGYGVWYVIQLFR